MYFEYSGVYICLYEQCISNFPVSTSVYMNNVLRIFQYLHLFLSRLTILNCTTTSGSVTHNKWHLPPYSKPGFLKRCSFESIAFLSGRRYTIILIIIQNTAVKCIIQHRTLFQEFYTFTRTNTMKYRFCSFLQCRHFRKHLLEKF